MNRKKFFIFLSGITPSLGTIIAANSERPNIIVILADDMGYSDIGCYGGEICTPNIDSLARNGIKYRQFYNGARSCPTRASLLTGLYAHETGIGWMAAADLGYPAYQGTLNNHCVTLAEVMKSAGYSTYMSGKWHVSSDRKNNGKVKDNWPNQRGFDQFFGIVGGGANYFDLTYNINNEQFKSSDIEGFYFTHAISDYAVKYIQNHNFGKSPLFMYLAYTAPHWPLHALQQDIDKYKDVYTKGWDKLREERFERQKKMGLFSNDVRLTPRDKNVPAWDSLTNEEKSEFAMRMAIYAAQVDAMDQGIGRVINQLKIKGQLDNTLIMFLSDNGACAEFISSGKRKAVDGKVDTFESYRKNWANLSSTPYKEYKHHTNEGGIATPMIVHYPNGIRNELKNTFVNEYGHITDIMATCVEVAKAKYPKEFKGEKIHPMRGVSLTPNFVGKNTGRGKTYWEHEANIAVRDGKWKIVTMVPEGGVYDENKIELYDMEKDPTEMNDLSTIYPETRNRLYEDWKKWAVNVDVFPLDTRSYGQRQIDYKKKCINGGFDDNFGDWSVFPSKSENIKFSIDTENTITGNRTARVDIIKKTEKPSNGSLKWSFKAKKNEKVYISFKSKSSESTEFYCRLENKRNVNIKPIDQLVKVDDKVTRYLFDSELISQDGDYQLVFYVGNSFGTIWFDDVTLTVK